VLKLIYHSPVFGSIDFEYDRPLISVGRAEDNNLVLRHESVELHHCFLLFRGEKLICLPRSKVPPAPADLPHVSGRELGSGDSLWIGELQFTLGHSTSSVTLHAVSATEESCEFAPGKGALEPAVGERQFYCPQCLTFIPESQVKRVGLVGHAKRNLCPKCSRVLEGESGTEKVQIQAEAQDDKKGLRRVLVSYQTRLLRRARGRSGAG
jgi:hypothetical protein